MGLLDRWAAVYFGVGRLLYFGGPIFIGWLMGLVAARQRMNALWPTVGVAVIGLIGALAQVHANQPPAPGLAGHVGLDFAAVSSIQDISTVAFHCLVILALAVLPWPWLLWRREKSSAA